MPDTTTTLQCAPRPWRPTTAIRLTWAFHLVCLGVLVVQPSSWPWLLAALITNHLLLAVAGMWPRSHVLGPNLRRLPAASAARGEVAVTFDDGPDPVVTPRVLDILDRYQAKATFFVVGCKAAAHPDIIRTAVARGHRVENHSFRHANTFAFHGTGGMARDIEAAQHAIGTLTGRAPEYFRAPMGIRNPFLEPALARLGLRLVSWTRRGYDAVNGDAAAVLRRLTRGLAAGDVLVLHDGSPALMADGQPVVLAVLPQLLERIRTAGLTAVALPPAADE